MKHFIFLFALLLFIVGCDTHIDPNKPPSGFIQTIESPNSTIFLPIGIDLKETEDNLNAKIPKGKIFDEKVEKGNPSVTLKIWRDEPVKLDIDKDGYIVLNTRLKFNAYIVAWKWVVAKITQTAHVDDYINVAIRVKPSINSDYTLNIEPKISLKADGNVHAKTSFFGNAIRVSYDITKDVNKALKKEEGEIKGIIAKELTKEIQKINLKPELEKQWTKLSKGRKAGDTWVMFDPDKVLFRGFYKSTDNKEVRIGVGFQGKLKVSLDKPSPINKPLPKLENTKLTDPIFMVDIPIRSDFSTLETELNKDYKDKKTLSGNYELTIKRISLNGLIVKGVPALLIAIDFKARENEASWFNSLSDTYGRLYFTAVPEIDVTNQIVRVKDFELTSESSSMIFDKKVLWLTEFKYNEIKKSLKLNLKPEIEKVTKELNSKLSKGKRIDNLTIKGKITEMGLHGFHIDNNKIEIYSRARGRVLIEYK